MQTNTHPNQEGALKTILQLYAKSKMRRYGVIYSEGSYYDRNELSDKSGLSHRTLRKYAMRTYRKINHP